MGIEIARVDETGVYGFFGEYRYLSNFHVCNVVVDGKLFPSSEHAFMYGKLTDKAKEERFHRLEKCVDSDPIPVDMTTWYDEVILMSCKDVKAWGRTVDLRPDWNDIKIKVMEEALLSKFTLNEDIKQKLKDTGDLYLEETNWWKDTFWGVCDGVGENNLGKCLMRVRNDLKWI
jgi:ribA/ribD-fused uncharacterized protein